MMKRLLTILIIVFISCGLIALLFYEGYLRFNYPSSEEFPIQGIDISHHQGKINWQKIKDNNISFVFIKATEGEDYVDKDFNGNWKNSKFNGYVVGAYHYFRLCTEGKKQAENFIKTVPKETWTLPPVIDLEFGGNCKSGPETQVIHEIQNCIFILKEYYGKTPIIYVTKEFYDTYCKDNFKECPIWIRNIYSKPKLINHEKWRFWQFANRGRISGVISFVDLSVFNGDRNEFEKIIRGAYQ